MRPVSQKKTLRAMGELSFAAVALAVLIVISLHALEPQFDPAWRTLSEYVLGPFGPLMSWVFVLLAAAPVALAAPLWPATRGAAGRIGVAFMFLWSAGIFVAGRFATDPMTAAGASPPSHSGAIHALSAFVALPSFALGATLIGRSLSRNSDWREIRSVLRWLSVLVWLGLAAFLTSAAMLVAIIAKTGHVGPGSGSWLGVGDRIVVASYCLWLLTVSRRSAKRA